MSSKSPKKAAQRPPRNPHWRRAEQACQHIAHALSHPELSPYWEGENTAGQYARMALVYHKRIRNAKVLTAGDFNLAADTASYALRALSALDASLNFQQLPQTEALLLCLQAAKTVLEDMQRLKEAGKR